MPNPSVFPVPVLAWPMMSWPLKATGRVMAWMGEGVRDASVGQGLNDVGAHVKISERLLFDLVGRLIRDDRFLGFD